jgi:signal transduction histidine kinase
VIHGYTPANEPWELWQHLERGTEAYRALKAERCGVFAQLLDPGWIAVPVPAVALDPLKFRDEKRYTDRLKEAKATSELNSELARDLTLLQEENAKLKSHVKELMSETHMITKLAADRTKSVTQLEQENAKLKSELKDLAHSLSQPDAVVIGDLETELKRCDAEPVPAPEPASHEPFSCGGCRWYSDSNSETGLCCRHAPAHDGFPRVAVKGWCGDFTGNGTGTTTASGGTIQ